MFRVSLLSMLARLCSCAVSLCVCVCARARVCEPTHVHKCGMGAQTARAMGNAAFQEKSYEEASKHYELAIKLDPSDPEVHDVSMLCVCVCVCVCACVCVCVDIHRCTHTHTHTHTHTPCVDI